MSSPSTLLIDPKILTELWHQNLSLSHVQQDIRLKLHRWMKRRTKCSYSLFLTGSGISGSPTEEDMTNLSVGIMTYFKPMTHAVCAMQVLGKIIDYHNSKSLFQICPPPIPTLSKGDASPFAHAELVNLKDISTFRQLMAHSVRNNSPKINQPNATKGEQESHKILLGQVLLSSILHGGLIHRSLLERLIEMLVSEPCILQSTGKRVYVEFSLKYKNQENAEFRRWFPDALTAVLIMQLPKDTIQSLFIIDSSSNNHDAIKNAVWKCIKAFLRSVGLSNQQIPNLLPQLLGLTKLDLETRIPIFLVNYAARDFVSHSLKPHVWRRLHHLPSTPPVKIKQDQSTDSDRLELPDVIDQDEIESRWLQEFRQHLKGTDRSIIINQINDLLNSQRTRFVPETPGALFAGFALYILRAKNIQTYRFALSSMRDYVISASKRLGGLLGVESVGDLDSLSWSNLYEEVLSDAESIGLRRKILRVLREFQNYLEAEKGIPSLEDDVLKTQMGLVPVDANVLSEDEFLKVRHGFWQNSIVTNPKDTICWLVLTLAYRCGLRRSEVLMLELSDVHSSNPAELLIRPNAARRLKTPSATRKIPIQALLHSEDLSRLREWLKMRNAQEQSNPFSQFLFALPKNNQESLDADSLIESLHRTMRSVTGDQNLRFHHLRHSFANGTLLQLVRDPSKKSLDTLLPQGFLEKTNSVMPNSFRKSLYKHTQISRRDPWAVASLLGHSGPQISMEHYVHVLDLCLATELMNSEIAPLDSTVINATGKPLSTFKRYQSRTQNIDLHFWVAYLLKKAQGKTTTTLKPTQEIITLGQSVIEYEKLNLAWDSLRRHETESVSAESLAKTLNVTPTIFNACLNRATILSQLKISNTGKEFRHRFMEWTPDKRQPSIKKRISCPIRPRGKEDWVVLEKLVPLMRSVRKEQPQLTKKIIEYYAQHSRPDFTGVIFTDPSDPNMAKLFLEWFNLLGIPRTQLLIESFDMTNRSKLTAQWRAGLKLHPSEIQKAYPPIGRKTWACPWLGITPLFKQGDDIKSSPAFRFLMVMMYVVG